MSVKFLGLVDGRCSQALRALHKLAALGFTEADMPELVQAYLARVEESRPGAIERSASGRPDKRQRQELAELSIRTMMALGFNATEIGGLARLNPATVAHLVNPFDDRSVSEECALTLKALVHTLGAERLSLLVPQMDINVLDTCCDKGRSFDAATRPEIAHALRILILNALVLSATPVPGVAGIHAFLAQVGDPENFVFLFGALPSDTPQQMDQADDDIVADPNAQQTELANRRLAHLKLAEHEAEHLVQRFREERQRLERDLQGQRTMTLPKDGNIA